MSIKIGLIGGSGLGAALAAREPSTTPQYVNTPFGKPSGTILESVWAGIPVCVLARHGNGHTLNPSHVPYRANIYALKVLGCTHILASGAVGSLREEYKPRHVVVPDQAIQDLIRYYTREAGVRSLERELGGLARKTVRDLARENVKSITIDDARLAKYAGVRKYRYGETDEVDQVGIVTGLAWTEFGGDILTIEAVKMPGKGRMTVTGNLKDVMKESISAAASYVRARSLQFGVKPPVFEKICELMPTTWPPRLNSGPPELPRLIGTSVWMNGTYC